MRKVFNNWLHKMLYAVFAVVFLITFAVPVFGCSSYVVELNCICENNCAGECNFSLVVEVDRDTFALGEFITATATLTNLSGQDLRISFGEILRPYVDGRWYDPQSGGVAFRNFYSGNIISQADQIGWSYFDRSPIISEPREYELKFKATFSLNDNRLDHFFGCGAPNFKTIHLISNIIILTVYENNN